MNPYLSKRVLLFLPLLLIVITAMIIHNSVIANTLDEKLKKLHASGVYIDMIHEKNEILSNKKHFIIRLDKVELIAELLFGVQSSDPILVHLSKMQGLKLNIELVHKKFIFSNELLMFISMDDLPEYFTNQSILFNDVLEFSKSNPKMIETTFNVWDHSFAFHIPTIKHLFHAENNISYDVDIDHLSLKGYIKSHTDFDITNRSEKLSIIVSESNTTKASLNVKDHFFNIFYVDNGIDSSMGVKKLDLRFDMEAPVSLQLEDFQASQSYQEQDTVTISSTLKLKHLGLTEKEAQFALKDLDYDIIFKHLDIQTVDDIRELIHTSNTHTVAFIFDDLSEDIASLIKHQAHFKLNNFSFNDLYLEGTHYNDAKLSFEALSQPENQELPVKLDMKLHLSQALYQSFLDQVPNASLTQHYIKDHNSSVDFHLTLTKEGFILNDQTLYFEPPYEDDNTTVDLNTSQGTNP